MKSIIVLDSSGDIKSLAGCDLVSVPLKIISAEREYVDDENLDLRGMVDALRQTKEKTSTACPGAGEYLDAFGDADNVYCVTITAALSGSYNAAVNAAAIYREQHPERNVHVFNSLSTGPEMVLIAERLRDLIAAGEAFADIVEKVEQYFTTTQLLFALESLHNLANNGRVSRTVATLAGILGIRMVGKASDHGTLEPLFKVRGAKRLPAEILREATEMGYKGGKMRITSCFNKEAAEELKTLTLAAFPNADVSTGSTGGLCGFYAEEGGLLIGFET